ncbi:MAG: hypothetical protein AB1578_23340, partial [Thermodesulfobacteriota bacterium]
MPELPGETGLVGVGCQLLPVLRVIQHLLDEAFDGLAGLDPEVLGDPGLLEARLLHELGHRPDALGGGQGQEEPVGVGEIAASLPVGVDGDSDLGAGTRRVAEEEAKLHTVGEEPQPLARGQEHPLGAAGVTVPVGRSPAGRGVEVLFEGSAPGPEPLLAVGRDQEVAAGLVPLPGLHLAGVFEPGVAEPVHQGLDHLVSHPHRPAAGDERPEPAAVGGPGLLEGVARGARGLGQEPEALDLSRQREQDEGLRARRAAE